MKMPSLSVFFIKTIIYILSYKPAGFSLHWKDSEGGGVLIYRINPDGSLAQIANIDDGKRVDRPALVLLKKIK
jgi:hypothetical protein